MPGLTTARILVVALALVACEKEGPTGPEGPEGPAGPVGLQGPVGPTGVSGLEIVTQTFANIPASPNTISVTCPSGKRVFAGGYALSHTGTEVGQSYPGLVSGSEAWIVSTFTPSGFLNNITLFALCANASSSGISAMRATPSQR